MKSYLRELSFGEIFKGSFEVYFQNFFTIFIIYALPIYPTSYIQNLLLIEGNFPLFWIFLVLNLLLTTIAYAAVAITLSDICLGNKPGIIRSYRYVLSSIFWKLLSTNLLQVIIIVIGMVLLVVPGIIFMIWLIFVPIVVVLENTWGIEALKRSKNLGKDFFFRTLGLLIVIIIVAALFGGIVGAISGAVFGDVPQALLLFIEILVGPLALIMIVLSYYDLRARKEAYDTASLAEDLRH